MTDFREAQTHPEDKILPGTAEHFERLNPYAQRAHDLCDHNKRAGNVGGPPPETEEGRRARLDEARVMAALAHAYEDYKGRLR